MNRLNSYYWLILILSLHTWPGFAQNQGSAESLLLGATKEQYKLDNEIREIAWNDIQLKWANTLGEIEQFLNNNTRYDRETINRFSEDIQHLIEKAEVSIKKAKESVANYKLLIDGLGASYTQTKLPEKIRIIRNQLNTVQTFYQQQVSKLEELINSAEELKLVLSSLRRQGMTQIITKRLDIPFLPSTIVAANGYISKKLSNVATTLSEGVSGLLHASRLWLILIYLSIAALLAHLVGRHIHHKFGPDATIRQPSNSRKLSAVLARGVAIGLITAVMTIILYVMANKVFVSSVADFQSVFNLILLHLLVLSLSLSLCIAILSPRLPGWHLTKLSAQKSSRLCRGLIYLLIVESIHSLLIRLLDVDLLHSFSFLPEQNNGASLLGTIFNILTSLGLIYLFSPSFWQTGYEIDTQATSTAMESFWMLVRLSILVLTITSIIASLMGYVLLGDYLNLGVFFTIIVFSISYFLRTVVRELISSVIKLKWMRRLFNLRIITLQSIKFWSSLIINLVFFSAALIISLTFWGLPIEKVFQFVNTAFEGITVGKLRISLKGIMLAIIVYIVLMRLLHFIQNFITQNIFPKSNQDVASQHNTLTIIRYFGVLIALTAAIAALGVDFKTIALIMGALSVGIGFGLSTIVSNFISGLLLLFEKPIKVGDWIQIGEHEGVVKNVKFRSTELETFQRASVIIPNADLITQPVINMTLVDRQGRIEVPVSVAYKNDPLVVHNLLMDIAQQDPDVLEQPEPQVLFMAFGENSLDFELRCYAQDIVNKFIIASELRFQIERKLREKGIEIPFPQRVVHLQTKQQQEVETKVDDKSERSVEQTKQKT